MKNYMKYPFIPIAFFYVNGIFFSNDLVDIFSFKLIGSLTIVLLVFSVFFYFFLSKRQNFNVVNRLSTLIFFFLFFFIGILSFQNFKLENKFTTKEYHFGVLTIDEVLKSNQFQNRYFGEFSTIDNFQQKIVLYQPLDNSKLKVGERIEVVLYIEEIPLIKNPHQFDYSKYLANKNIFIQAKIPQDYILLAPNENFKFKLLRFREVLMKSFDIHGFPDEVKGVVYALFFGQRADLSEKIVTNYRNAGVMHILAISGLHIGILYWILNLILQRFIRSKNIRFVLVITILCCFAIISGLSGSVVRAVLMFFIVGLGMIFKRKTDTVNVLALSMFCILIVNPNFLFDIGFQLSYLAVFSIVYLYPIIQKIFCSRYKIWNYFLELIGISIVAQLGILPLAIYYFGQISFLFILGNLIVIPLLTLVLIGLVFLLILNFIWKDLALILGKAIVFLIEFANYSISFIASKSDFIISNIKMNLVQCMLFLCLIFLLAYTIKKYALTKLIVLCFLIIALQFSYFYDAKKVNSVDELLLFYDYNSVSLTVSRSRQMVIFSTDSLIDKKTFIVDVLKENEILNKQFCYITNYFEIDDLHFLVVDSLGVTNISTPIEILILKDNPKFNLERYLINNQPKLIIAHPKNYELNVKRWKESCEQNKIPFHDMREKGYVDLSSLF